MFIITTSKESKVNPSLEYDLGLGARQSPLQGAGQSLPVQGSVSPTPPPTPTVQG